MEMKDEVEIARQAVWDHLQSGQRANRRKAIQVYGLIDKAARLLGLPRIERAPRKSAPAQVTYPATTEPKQAAPEQDNQTVLADNRNEPTGPERVKRGPKPKGV
jgi:hypothetical protein